MVFVSRLSFADAFTYVVYAVRSRVSWMVAAGASLRARSSGLWAEPDWSEKRMPRPWYGVDSVVVVVVVVVVVAVIGAPVVGVVGPHATLLCTRPLGLC